jgi:hypothetical protein
LFEPGHSGAGSGLLGIGIPFLEWFGFIMGFAVVITWVQNHAHGSVLPAMLFHASINATHDNFPSAFFPKLFPPAVAAHAAIPLLTEVSIMLVAILLVVATRGRLGYQHSLRETALPAPLTDRGQEPGTAGTSG